jgi:hypothetical protein
MSGNTEVVEGLFALFFILNYRVMVMGRERRSWWSRIYGMLPLCRPRTVVPMILGKKRGLSERNGQGKDYVPTD